MYGVGFEHHIKWILPVMGSAFISFSIVIAVNVAIVYPIDVYKVSRRWR